MERQKFEESFKDAFEKAEVGPSENVWTNIELDLERLESGKMKRRVLFYKLVAAASIAFALAIAGVGYYKLSTEATVNNIAQNNNSSDTSTLRSPSISTVEENVSKSENNSLSALENDHASNKVSTTGKSSANNNSSVKPNTSDNNFSDVKNISPKLTTATDMADPGEASVVSPLPVPGSNSLAQSELSSHDREAAYNRKLPPLVRKRKIEIVFPKTEPDEFDLMLARESWKEKNQKKFAHEKVWTSVGFSAGSFSGATSSASLNTLRTSPADMVYLQNYSVANTLSNEATASGVAYSVGVNVGTRLSKRLVLQGGFNYMQQNSNYTSNAVITTDYQNYSVANSAEISKISNSSSDARIVNTSPYDVNNSLQFLSLPIQAGYVLLNRSFAIQLNGGVSTDLFLQNTITPEGGTLDKVSNSRGDDSPYRPVNFSGLVGTEFSYRFADRYRLALTPGLRYPFGSIYKSETGLQANPLTFDVGLRFRYIFH